MLRRRQGLAALFGGAWALAFGLPTQALARDATRPHGLHGLARLQLPARFRLRGLAVRDRSLSPAEQLLRHDDRRGLVFEFEAEARNDWGGHALAPLLLNVLLLDPARPAAEGEAGFSIGRYFPLTGGAIPLDDARWQQRRDTQGRLWRRLGLRDPYGAAQEPRWALSVHDPARALRLDLFVWQKRLSADAAEALLADALTSLVLDPARDRHFAQAAQAPQRLDTRRAQQVQAFFAELAPLGVPPAGPGGVTLGPDTAAWQDGDGRALRVLRLLGRVRLDTGVPRDAAGRPRLPMTPSLVPSVAPGALPAWRPSLLYRHAASGTWRKTGLDSAEGPADWPLLPIEAALAARLPDDPAVAYLVAGFHAYQPPVLDDAAGLGTFLAQAERWREALQGARVLVVPALPARLQESSR